MEIRKYNGDGTFYSFGNRIDLVSMFLLNPKILGGDREKISGAINEGYSPVHSAIFNGNIRLQPNERKAFVVEDKFGSYLISVLGRDEYGRTRTNHYLANPNFLELAVSERLLSVDEKSQNRFSDIFLEALVKKFGEGNVFMVKSENNGFSEALNEGIMKAYQGRAESIDQRLTYNRVA